MRNEILEILKNAKGKFISGESIANQFNVSRVSVWKHVQKLRKIGYDVKSFGSRGYSLPELPDLLLPEIIRDNLHTKIIGVEPARIIYFDSTESTNIIAKKLAADNAAEGTVIIAEEQTGGKGRLDRKFFSPKYKSILFSLILRPKCLPKDAPKFTLMAAVAIILAMKKFNLSAGIKWPNDIIFDNRKVVGILTEMSAAIEQVNYIVIGVGINANISAEDFPEDIKKIAASLAEMNGNNNISRTDFFCAVLEEFDKLYSEMNFENIFELWRKYNITLNQNVKVISAESGDIFTGKAIDIDSDGALVISTDTGNKTVYAGDVSVRKI